MLKTSTLMQSLLVRADAVPFSPLRIHHNGAHFYGTSPAHLDMDYPTIQQADIRLFHPVALDLIYRT
jgi:hypothetical protein